MLACEEKLKEERASERAVFRGLQLQEAAVPPLCRGSLDRKRSEGE